jgi:hypothetical protein
MAIEIGGTPVEAKNGRLCALLMAWIAFCACPLGQLLRSWQSRLDRLRAAALQRFVIVRSVPGFIGRGCRSTLALRLPYWIHAMNPSHDLCNRAANISKARSSTNRPMRLPLDLTGKALIGILTAKHTSTERKLHVANRFLHGAVVRALGMDKDTDVTPISGFDASIKALVFVVESVEPEEIISDNEAIWRCNPKAMNILYKDGKEIVFSSRVLFSAEEINWSDPDGEYTSSKPMTAKGGIFSQFALKCLVFGMGKRGVGGHSGFGIEGSYPPESAFVMVNDNNTSYGNNSGYIRVRAKWK